MCYVLCFADDGGGRKNRAQPRDRGREEGREAVEELVASVHERRGKPKRVDAAHKHVEQHLYPGFNFSNSIFILTFQV
jgi:hypothetical protein